ncbi:hypothetical protein [Nocardia pseudovaccinii]|uniref:hypothetical protein n=1 Tax=Nocardia pseudovaccinii TaxID=189540 RepID=UPI000A7C08DD|nr:hypothetical protein [Nocardia pseudovaccinii]
MLADNRIEDSDLSGDDKDVVESVTAGFIAEALTDGRISSSPLRALARHERQNSLAVS